MLTRVFRPSFYDTLPTDVALTYPCRWLDHMDPHHNSLIPPKVSLAHSPVHPEPPARFHRESGTGEILGFTEKGPEYTLLCAFGWIIYPEFDASPPPQNLTDCATHNAYLGRCQKSAYLKTSRILVAHEDEQVTELGTHTSHLGEVAGKLLWGFSATRVLSNAEVPGNFDQLSFI